MIDFTKPVQTRDGRAVRILATDVKNDNFPVTAVVTDADGLEDAESYTAEGRYYFDDPEGSGYDLVNVDLSAVQAKFDDAAVDRFAAQMKARLAEKRDQDYGGWNDPAQVTDSRLAYELIDAVKRGSLVGVANYAMFLHERGAEPSTITEQFEMFVETNPTKELEYLRFFHQKTYFGPAHEDVVASINAEYTGAIPANYGV